MDLPILDVSYKWNYITCILLCLAFPLNIASLRFLYIMLLLCIVPWLNSIPMYTAFCLSIYKWMNTWVVSTFWLLRTVLLWMSMYIFLCEYIFLVFLYIFVNFPVLLLLFISLFHCNQRFTWFQSFQVYWSLVGDLTSGLPGECCMCTWEKCGFCCGVDCSIVCFYCLKFLFL